MKSDTALMLLHGISGKVKSRPLLERAREKIASISSELGLLPEDLADRTVPTLGLDDDGSRILDFGPRQFRVGFDESLRPFVRDADHRKLPELPKPGRNDDEEKADDAANEWKDLKKAAKAVGAAQLARLENAMIAQRRWKPEVFQTYFVKHPFLGHLVRRLAFGAYARGALLRAFRVAEDGSYADENDDAFVIPEGATVSVLHPLEVPPATLTALGERFTEYEILQPFAQLAREVPREVTSEDALEFRPIEARKLLGLERRGWRRGRAGERGLVNVLEKEIGTLRASLSLEPGIAAGDPTSSPTQEPQELVLTSPHRVFLAEVTADLQGVGAVTSGA